MRIWLGTFTLLAICMMLTWHCNALKKLQCIETLHAITELLGSPEESYHEVSASNIFLEPRVLRTIRAFVRLPSL